MGSVWEVWGGQSLLRSSGLVCEPLTQINVIWVCGREQACWPQLTPVWLCLSGLLCHHHYHQGTRKEAS